MNAANAFDPKRGFVSFAIQWTVCLFRHAITGFIAAKGRNAGVYN